MGKFCHMATSRSSFRKYRENQNIGFQTLNWFSLTQYHKLGVLGIAGKLSVPSIALCKKNSKKFKIYCSGATQDLINHNMVDRNFLRVNLV